jgi:hypothetical protein
MTSAGMQLPRFTLDKTDLRLGAVRCFALRCRYSTERFRSAELCYPNRAVRYGAVIGNFRGAACRQPQKPASYFAFRCDRHQAKVLLGSPSNRNLVYLQKKWVTASAQRCLCPLQRLLLRGAGKGRPAIRGSIRFITYQGVEYHMKTSFLLRFQESFPTDSTPVQTYATQTSTRQQVEGPDSDPGRRSQAVLPLSKVPIAPTSAATMTATFVAREAGDADPDKKIFSVIPRCS